jgi:hypothetical protein
VKEESEENIVQDKVEKKAKGITRRIKQEIKEEEDD